MTEKQKLQQGRAYFKFILTGLVKPLISSVQITKEERELWEEIIAVRNKLLDMCDENSRTLGLNVPEHRCYVYGCYNKAKYEVKDIFGDPVYACKKHYKESKRING